MKNELKTKEYRCKEFKIPHNLFLSLKKNLFKTSFSKENVNNTEIIDIIDN
jgi:hypothetical protein